MSSPFQRLIGPDRADGERTVAADPSTQKLALEILRVQSDKLILILLLILLHTWGAPETTQAGVVGAILLAIQGQRFSRK